MAGLPTHRPRRMLDLPELGVDAAAGADPDVLRLENLDTDVPPPAAVLEATRASVGVDAANSYDVVPAAGGSSLLVDVAPRGLTAREAAQRLLERGRVAATAMDGWGPSNRPQHVRVVFANVPPERLVGLGDRFAAALG